MKNLLPLTVLFLSTLIIWGCNKPVKPEFKKLNNVKFGSVMVDKGVGLNVSADALLNNPNAFGVTISKLDFEVFVDGTKVSDMVQEVSAEMPANSDFTLPLTFKVPLDKAFAGFRPTISEMMKNRAVTIKVKGDIYVKPAGVEFKLPFEYEDTYDVPLKNFLNFRG